jgi:broad specificity phosphatase PhoE
VNFPQSTPYSGRITRMTKLRNTYFLLRHGQADHIISGTIASKATEAANPPHLTKVGIAQARRAAEELVGRGINVIYSSPYARTMETAEIVADKLGLDINVDKRLRETDFGVLDGKPDEEMRKQFSGMLDRLYDRPEGGESLADVCSRVERFLEEVEAEHKGQNILVVAHADSLWALETLIRRLDIKEARLNEVGFGEGELREL